MNATQFSIGGKKRIVCIHIRALNNSVLLHTKLPNNFLHIFKKMSTNVYFTAYALKKIDNLATRGVKIKRESVENVIKSGRRTPIDQNFFVVKLRNFEVVCDIKEGVLRVLTFYKV